MISAIFSNRTVTQGLWRLFSVAAILLGAFVALLYWNTLGVQEVFRSIRQTVDVERELSNLGEDLLNAETGQRGFLLTHQDSYLGPYFTGNAAARKRLQHLHILAKNTQLDARIASMEPLVLAKLDELQRTVELGQQGQFAAALVIVNTNAGKNSMDLFRRARQTALERESQLLAERRTKLVSQLQASLLWSGVGGAGAVLFLLFTARRTSKQLQQPILHLLNGIETISQGNTNLPIQVVAQDEIGKITDAVNAMGRRIGAAQAAREAALIELKRSNNELDNFAYVASHDLKAPLRGIRNLAQWIEDDVNKTASEDTLENLRLLQTRVNRLDGLLESLLNYSRVGRKVEKIETVNSTKLVEEIKEYLGSSNHFEIICTGDLPVLQTHKAPFEQVLRNLINNAIKHHDRENGRIVVSAKDQGEFIEFCVADDGPGIAPEFHERIFQMFQTLKPRDEVEGSGMGLAIVKKIIEGFGGNIRVHSTPPHRGTAFFFTWMKESCALGEPSIDVPEKIPR